MTFDELSPVAKSTMCRLFINGPLHDGRAGKFKTGPAELVAAGLAERAGAYTFLNGTGVIMAGTANVTDKHWQTLQTGAG